MVTTVLKEITAQELGVTLFHEHLFPLERHSIARPDKTTIKPLIVPPTLQHIIHHLKTVRRIGLCTIVDVTPIGKRPSPRVFKLIARETGLNIIIATGFYKEPWIPSWVYSSSVQKIADMFIKEITEGIGNSGVKAGVIKVATSKNCISNVEAKILKAAAIAQKQTNVPIITHCTLGTMGLEQVQLLSKHGANPEKIVIGHIDLNQATDYVKRLAKQRIFLGFDTIGKEFFEYIKYRTLRTGPFRYEKELYYVPDKRRAQKIAALVKTGLASQLVLSHDLTMAEIWLNLKTHGKYGYSYIFTKFSNMLYKLGIARETVQQILSENIKKLFE